MRSCEMFGSEATPSTRYGVEPGDNNGWLVSACGSGKVARSALLRFMGLALI